MLFDIKFAIVWQWFKILPIFLSQLCECELIIFLFLAVVSQVKTIDNLIYPYNITPVFIYEVISTAIKYNSKILFFLEIYSFGNSLNIKISCLMLSSTF